MEITRIDANSKWSRAVIHNGVAYFCGQVAKSADMDAAEQMESALEGVDALLAQVGSDRKSILTATVYLKNSRYLAELNHAWEAWVPAGYAPARICVEAAAMNPDYLVEIAITAAVAMPSPGA